MLAPCCLAIDIIAATTLDGTWSTGTGAVVTGQSFFNLVNNTFNIPANPGQAYSFTMNSKTTGYWEQAIFQYIRSDSPDPNCYKGQLVWQHGNFTILPNASLVLEPFKSDGRQQVSDSCGGKNNQVQYYAQQELMEGFYISKYIHFNEPTYKLQLYEFDGTPKPAMYLTYRPPQMYPTQALHKLMIGLM
ncbi:hypothetical protein MNAN1_002027 [Malassezia nana]|uniref:Protein ROT1 n=1 Tax=Malassezia nana TaxID=180528 RepID=A0AAF0EME0_9BASI|nr:hypothetical protein MNAN1_002027 [Malassezia nana]